MKLIEIAVQAIFFFGWFGTALMATAAFTAFVWWLAMRPRWRKNEARELMRLMGGQE